MLLATQAVGMGPFIEGIGKLKLRLMWTKKRFLKKNNTGLVPRTLAQPKWHYMSSA